MRYVVLTHGISVVCRLIQGLEISIYLLLIQRSTIEGESASFTKLRS
jgi:hypothetical protein